MNEIVLVMFGKSIVVTNARFITALIVLACIFIVGYLIRNREKVRKLRSSMKEYKRLSNEGKSLQKKEDSAHRLQEEHFNIFLNQLAAALEDTFSLKTSLTTFTRMVLQIVKNEMNMYEKQITDPEAIRYNLPNYYLVLMMHASHSIMEYSDRKGLQAIGMDLMRFVEDNFYVKNLASVMHRHRQYIHFNERCEGMSLAVLEFFDKQLPRFVTDTANVPFDYLDDNDMENWHSFQRRFYANAIDITYVGFMKQIEKTSYAAQAKQDSINIQKNRRQRSKRLSKKNRKPRRST